MVQKAKGRDSIIVISSSGDDSSDRRAVQDRRPSHKPASRGSQATAQRAKAHNSAIATSSLSDKKLGRRAAQDDKQVSMQQRKPAKAQDSDSHDSFTTISSAEVDATKTWCSSTNIYVSDSGNLCVTRSSPELQAVFQDAYMQMVHHLLFQDAFPDRSPLHKHPWFRNFLKNAAAHWEQQAILDRIDEDLDYAKHLASAVSECLCFLRSNPSDHHGQLETRVSLFRTKFKTPAALKVSEHYGLIGQNDVSQRVEELHKLKHYIYPKDANVSCHVSVTCTS